MKTAKQTNFVSTQVAMVSAHSWLKAVAKKFGIKGAVSDVERDFVSLEVSGSNFGSDRFRRMDKLIDRTRAGFEKSKNWISDEPASTYQRSVFISTDGRFKAVVTKRYSDTLGWKLASMYYSVVITDLQKTA